MPLFRVKARMVEHYEAVIEAEDWEEAKRRGYNFDAFEPVPDCDSWEVMDVEEIDDDI